MFNSSFSSGERPMETRDRVITVGLKNPMPDVSKVIAEARVEGKGVDPIYFPYNLQMLIKTLQRI